MNGLRNPAFTIGAMTDVAVMADVRDDGPIQRFSYSHAITSLPIQNAEDDVPL